MFARIAAVAPVIPRRLLSVTVVIASVVVTACDGRGPSSLTAPSASATSTANRPFPRSGALHVTKDCSAYTGLAGDYCTITSSNLEQVEAGSRIVYASDAVWPLLDTDIVLDPPGPGNNAAFGHCALNLETGVGVCTFAGGTGKFTHFHASVAVSHLEGFNYAWEGAYSFSPKGV